jgi:hypothetical protein
MGWKKFWECSRQGAKALTAKAQELAKNISVRRRVDADFSSVSY